MCKIYLYYILFTFSFFNSWIFFSKVLDINSSSCSARAWMLTDACRSRRFSSVNAATWILNLSTSIWKVFRVNLSTENKSFTFSTRFSCVKVAVRVVSSSTSSLCRLECRFESENPKMFENEKFDNLGNFAHLIVTWHPYHFRTSHWPNRPLSCGWMAPPIEHLLHHLVISVGDHFHPVTLHLTPGPSCSVRLSNQPIISLEKIYPQSLLKTSFVFFFYKFGCVKKRMFEEKNSGSEHHSKKIMDLEKYNSLHQKK